MSIFFYNVLNSPLSYSFAFDVGEQFFTFCFFSSLISLNHLSVYVISVFSKFGDAVINHIIQAAFRKSSPKSEDTDDASTVNHRIEVKYGVEGNHVNPLNAGTVTLASSDEATGFVGEAMDEKGIVSKAYPDVREGTNNILNKKNKISSIYQ